MKRYLTLVPVLILSLLDSGCTTLSAHNAAHRLNNQAEASGSPYRYRVYNVPHGSVVERYRVTPPAPEAIPASLQPTTAGAELRKDLLAKIAALQQDWSSPAAPVLLGVQPLTAMNGATREAWFIKQENGAIRYEVTMTPSPQGGTDFQVKEP